MRSHKFSEGKATGWLAELRSHGGPHPLHKKGFLIDVDGVICRGMELIKGADEVVKELRNSGRKTIFVSNNSSKSPRLYREKMLKLGIEVKERELVLAPVVAAKHIKREGPTSKVYVVGGNGLKETMEEKKLEITEKPSRADYVVIGNPFKRDGKLRGSSASKITGAVRAILENDARFIAVNVDRIFPTENGPVPATGAIVKAISYSTGHSPDFTAGKPRKHIISLALNRLNLRAEECVLVGDSKVDMLAARNSGLKSVFVRSGASTERELKKEGLSPDFVLDSIKGLLEIESY